MPLWQSEMIVGELRNHGIAAYGEDALHSSTGAQRRDPFVANVLFTSARNLGSALTPTSRIAVQRKDADEALAIVRDLAADTDS